MMTQKMAFSALVALFLLVGLGMEAVPAKEIKMVAAEYLPPSYEDYFPPTQMFIDYVNKHGKGKVQIEFFHSGKLLKARELIPGLMQGTADIIFHTDSYVMGTSPILGILELPFLYRDENEISKKTKIGTPLFNLINQELAKQNLMILGSCPSPPEHIWTMEKPIRTAQDLQGLRVRTAGRVEAESIKALGAASTTLPSAELYEALKRGTVDAALCYAGTIPSRSLQEVLKYVNKGAFGSYSRQPFIRVDRWKALPKEVQDILLAAGKVMEGDGFNLLMKVHKEKYWPLIQKAGIKEIMPTKEETTRFREALMPVWEWWKKQVPAGVGSKAIELATQ